IPILKLFQRLKDALDLFALCRANEDQGGQCLIIEVGAIRILKASKQPGGLLLPEQVRKSRGAGVRVGSREHARCDGDRQNDQAHEKTPDHTTLSTKIVRNLSFPGWGRKSFYFSKLA